MKPKTEQKKEGKEAEQKLHTCNGIDILICPICVSEAFKAGQKSEREKIEMEKTISFKRGYKQGEFDKQMEWEKEIEENSISKDGINLSLEYRELALIRKLIQELKTSKLSAYKEESRNPFNPVGLCNRILDKLEIIDEEIENSLLKTSKDGE